MSYRQFNLNFFLLIILMMLASKTHAGVVLTSSNPVAVHAVHTMEVKK